MTTASIGPSSRLLRFLAKASLPLLVTLAGCQTNLTPTLAEGSGDVVEVVEAGAGGTTVVFESGLGNDWTPWDEVASIVAAHTRVFAYSRPGYGDSDPTSAPRDASRIVEDLRALLAARRIAPPYVLVGHSFGGTYMELFAKAHPEEVAGVILVDPRHRDFTAACEDAKLDLCSIPASALSSLSDVELAELRAFPRSSGEIHDAGEFGRHPVRVLTATSHDGSPEREDLWKSMLGSLAGEAADGEQILFPGAGHYLQTERPQEVAEAILKVLPAKGH